MEIWKDIKGYEGKYQISSLGRVRSLRRYKVCSGYRKPIFNSVTNYFTVALYIGERRELKYIHRLVAEAFIPNPHNYPQINHINEIRWDNRIENLEWCTNQYNSEYSRGIKIIQRDKNLQFIKEWKSAREIKKELGFDDSSIRKAAKNFPRKRAYGFYWENKENDF